MKIILAGAGAFGIKHLDALRTIKHTEGDVEIVGLVGRQLEPTREVATRYGITNVTTDLAEALSTCESDAVILCTPTQLHAAQDDNVLRRGSTFRWRYRLQTVGTMLNPWLNHSSAPVSFAWSVTPDDSIHRTNGFTDVLLRASSRFSKWMCRHSFSDEPT